MSAIFAFRHLFARRAGGLLLALLLSLVTLAAGVALLGTSGWFITGAALTTAGLAFNLFAPSALVRGFSFIRILARYGERLSGHDATLRLLADIRGWLFAKLFPRLPLNDRSMSARILDSSVLFAIEANLLNPPVISTVSRTYEAERNRLRHQQQPEGVQAQAHQQDRTESWIA